jgi:hypothetical protein
VANYEEIVNQVLSPEQHLALAERYANTIPAILADQSSRGISANQTDVALMDVYLHAAEVHLKLAEAKQRTQLVRAEDTLEQHLGSFNTTHADLSDVARRDPPSSKGQPSQIELLGG